MFELLKLLLPPRCCSRAGRPGFVKVALPADLAAVGRPTPPVGLPLIPRLLAAGWPCPAAHRVLAPSLIAPLRSWATPFSHAWSRRPASALQKCRTPSSQVCAVLLRVAAMNCCCELLSGLRPLAGQAWKRGAQRWGCCIGPNLLPPVAEQRCRSAASLPLLSTCHSGTIRCLTLLPSLPISPLLTEIGSACATLRYDYSALAEQVC